ncbi:beta family protein [Ensifer sp. MJa1]|uniref:beta family protein n=1 Tax=Ensifer sp. MJa1 TaxID=2919888 RepID=UPI003008F19A
MKLTTTMYVPSLRWRQGEYQALFRLSDTAKQLVVPFILVPEPEYDFEEGRPKKTVQEQVQTFPRRYQQKWGKRQAWIDVHSNIATTTMQDGRMPMSFVFDEIRKFGSKAVPVTSLDATPIVNGIASQIAAIDKLGMGIRARLEHVMRPNFDQRLGSLLSSIGLMPEMADLIIDLGAPNFQPYDDFADGLIAAMEGVSALAAYRSLVVIGTGFPQILAIDKPGGHIPRHDWIFFKTLRSKLNGTGRIPNFGDYTIVHPEFTAQDMRLLKPAGKLVYTAGDTWNVRKGGAFRADPAQMHTHCDSILKSGQFRGAHFSAGDEYIDLCAKWQATPSNLTRWKENGISHHIMHVLADLATPSAAP